MNEFDGRLHIATERINKSQLRRNYSEYSSERIKIKNTGKGKRHRSHSDKF